MLTRDSPFVTVLRWVVDFRGQRRAISRGVLFDVLGRVTPSLAVDTEGLRIYVSTADRVVSRKTFATGVYDSQLFSRVLGELKRVFGPDAGVRNRCFLDIGANIGTATCLALGRYGASSAWAFEPASQNLKLLRQNLIANGLEARVTVEACAVSDQDGVLALELSEKNWGDHRLRSTLAPHGDPLSDDMCRSTVDVPTRRLDTLAETGTLNLDSVGLAWIDVQGHEARVLAGARQLLQSSVPIVCEYWPHALNGAGGLDYFHQLVAEGRSRFIDLGGSCGTVRSTADVNELADHYPGAAFTNLLLLP